MMKRPVSAALLPTLFILFAVSCASTGMNTTPAGGVLTSTTAALNPLASLAVRVVSADACDQATRQGGASALLTKISAAEALVSSGNILSAVESTLLSGMDARRAFYIDLLIQAVQVNGNLPKTAILASGSPAAQLITSALSGCRAGIGLNSSTSVRAKAEALEAPAPSLSTYMYKVGYTDSIAKGTFYFDTSLPLDQRLVHGRLDMSALSGTYERSGLDPSKIKGPMVGPEGGSCDVIQWWIINIGPTFNVPSSYQCTSADIWDAMYTDGRRGQNAWNDIYLSAYIVAHPVVAEPINPSPGNPPPVNPVCLSGGCFPDLCPQNCATVPPMPPAPPVVPGCPVCQPAPIPPACVTLPTRVTETLRQRAAGHAVLNPARLREVADFFAQHAGSCWIYGAP